MNIIQQMIAYPSQMMNGRPNIPVQKKSVLMRKEELSLNAHQSVTLTNTSDDESEQTLRTSNGMERVVRAGIILSVVLVASSYLFLGDFQTRTGILSICLAGTEFAVNCSSWEG